MKPQPITSKQFAWWLAISGSAVLLWITAPEMMGLAGGLMGMSSLVLTSREERDRPLPIKDGIIMLLSLTGFFALVFFGKLLIPEASERKLDEFVGHPGFILPLWLAIAGIVCRRWLARKNKSSGSDQFQSGIQNG